MTQNHEDLNHDVSNSKIETEFKEPPTKKRKIDSILKDLDIQEIILSDPIGSALNVIYQRDKKLLSIYQSRLVAIVFNYLLKEHGT